MLIAGGAIMRGENVKSPESLKPGIRNGARAVIVRDAKILLLRKVSPVYGERYVLPGGSQEEGETLEQALRRECEEEIGASIGIVDLMNVADYFKPRLTTPETYRQAVEFLFACTVDEEYVAQNGPRPDKNQVAVIWMPLDRLPHEPLFPKGLIPALRGVLPSGRPVYLGLVD